MEEPIVQEEPMGCAIACVAFALNKPYEGAKKLFDNPAYSFTRGYYCREIVKVFKKQNKNYIFSKVNKNNQKILNNEGTIVFIEKIKNIQWGTI